MCFICRFNVYFSRNQRKCSQNGEDENLKFMRQMIYHLVGHEILNITVHFMGEGGVQPYFCPWKNVCFPIFPWAKMGLDPPSILFFISTYISRVDGENVRKISKNGYLKIQIYESNDISFLGV